MPVFLIRFLNAFCKCVVEQYGGMYSFSQQQDQFVLRISL